MSSSEAVALRAAEIKARGKKTEPSPLAQLLHALNQPLTGLQCSMEVALTTPRTPRQYVQGLREGLELTERMRFLVEAIREVTDLQEPDPQSASRQPGEAGYVSGGQSDLRAGLLEAAEDLGPVAESKGLGIVLEFSRGSEGSAEGTPAWLRATAFRLLESVIALAECGTVMALGVVSEKAEIGLQVSWQGRREDLPSVPSRAEIGLLVAQAQWEHGGGLWERRTTDGRERLTLGLRDLSLSPLPGETKVHQD